MFCETEANFEEEWQQEVASGQAGGGGMESRPGSSKQMLFLLADFLQCFSDRLQPSPACSSSIRCTNLELVSPRHQLSYQIQNPTLPARETSALNSLMPLEGNQITRHRIKLRSVNALFTPDLRAPVIMKSAYLKDKPSYSFNSQRSPKALTLQNNLLTQTSDYEITQVQQRAPSQGVLSHQRYAKPT